ncbi:MAG TPA: GntR family transcriptional regulator [Armatimonadota bacterium]|nr:GntR family transcriptional regulator [Armatimonadota bacterium]
MSVPGKQTKYRELLESLRTRIRAGELRPGDQVPTLDQLCEAYGVSRMTARSAISVLINERVLYSVRGKGTFIADTPSPSRTIALIFPHFIGSHSEPEVLYEYLYDMPLVGAIEQSARENGINFLLYICDDDIAMERQNIRTVLQQHVDAAIIFYIGGEENRDALDELRASGIPTVLIDHSPRGWDGNFVGTDNYAGAHQAAEQLLDQGFSRIYYMTTPENISSNLDRLDGAVSAMRGHGVYSNGSVIRLSEYNRRMFMQEAASFTEKLVREEEQPFAIFTNNSQVFLGVWHALCQMNISLEQIGLACFDTPPITFPPEAYFVKVVQQLEQMGRESVQMVVKILAGQPQPQRVVLPPSVHLPAPAHVEMVR